MDLFNPSTFNEIQDLQGPHILDAIDGVSTLPPEREDAPGAKDPEVLGNVRLFEVEFLPDVGHTTTLLIEKFEDPDPRGMGQSLEVFSLNCLFLIHIDFSPDSFLF